MHRLDGSLATNGAFRPKQRKLGGRSCLRSFKKARKIRPTKENSTTSSLTKAEQVKLINDIPAVGEFIMFNDEFGFVIGRVIKLHESHVRVVRLYINELDEWFEHGDAYQVDVSRTKIVKLVKLHKRKVKEDEGACT
jgi:hypothetical protein